MTVLESILLGLVQGVAEFLPISSSGHLAIAQNLLGLTINDGILFDVLLHLGTLVAVIIAYWKDVVDMIREFFLGVRDLARHSTPTPVPPARRLVLLIVVATLPLFLVLPIQDAVESLYDNMWFIGGALIATGFLLRLSDSHCRGKKTEKTASIRDVFLIGLAQAIATVPGISRSGMTITAGCLVGLERRFAVRFAFLMSLPAVVGANILSIADAVAEGMDWSLMPIYAVGMVTAAVSGYFCIRLLNMISNKGRFGLFAYYCWIVGVAVLLLTAFG